MVKKRFCSKSTLNIPNLPISLSLSNAQTHTHTHSESFIFLFLFLQTLKAIFFRLKNRWNAFLIIALLFVGKNEYSDWLNVCVCVWERENERERDLIVFVKTYWTKRFQFDPRSDVVVFVYGQSSRGCVLPKFSIKKVIRLVVNCDGNAINRSKRMWQWVFNLNWLSFYAIWATFLIESSLKPSCHIRFPHAFSALCCVFEVIIFLSIDINKSR